MFDTAYLATMTIDELETLADGVHQSMVKEQKRGEFALSGWWYRLELEVREELWTRYIDIAGTSYARDQLSLADMPGRVAPDDRHAA